MIFGVDANCYPFFIYNQSDEEGVSQNVYAKVLPDPSNSSSKILIVNINDDAVVYDTITLPASQQSGFLTVTYNDGKSIYLVIDTWVFKFDYYDFSFSISLASQVSPTPMLDWDFKKDDFAILWGGGGQKYDYVYFQPTNQNKHFYHFFRKLTK